MYRALIFAVLLVTTVCFVCWIICGGHAAKMSSPKMSALCSIPCSFITCLRGPLLREAPTSPMASRTDCVKVAECHRQPHPFKKFRDIFSVVL